MIELSPCQACRRHVGVHEVVCPFCRVTLAPATPQRIVLRGRVARAAVFGAALAAGACSESDKPAKPAPHTGSGSGVDKELEHMLDDPTAFAGSGPAPAPPPIDAAVVVVVDAGVPPDAFVDTAARDAEHKRREAERHRLEAERHEAERRRLEAERQRELQRQLDRTNVAKPYGAPPARRRVV